MTIKKGVNYCIRCKKALRDSNKSGVCSNCRNYYRREERVRPIGTGKRRTLNVTIKRDLYNKLISYFKNNSINKAAWFTKIITEKLNRREEGW